MSWWWRIEIIAFRDKNKAQELLIFPMRASCAIRSLESGRPRHRFGFLLDIILAILRFRLDASGLSTPRFTTPRMIPGHFFSRRLPFGHQLGYTKV
jgi:hypothetical protein